MKKIILSLAVLMALSYACDKDDDDDGNGDEVFTEETVEDTKQNVQTEGIELVDEMGSMADEQAFDVTASMVDIMSINDPFEGISTTSAFVTPAYIVAKMDAKDPGYMLEKLKSVIEDSPDLQSEIDKVKGIYTWNSATQVWDKTSVSENEIILKFPSTAEGTMNNAIYKVYDVVLYSASLPTSSVPQDVFKSIKADLSVDGTSVMSAEFASEYYDDGMPSSISYTIKIGNYSYNASFSHEQNKKIDVSYSWKKGDEVLIGLTYGMGGDWSPSNLQNMNPEAPEDIAWTIINNANVTFQLKGVAIVGEADFKTVGEASKQMNKADSTSVATFAGKVNDAVNLYMKYTENNQIIAKVKAYTVKKYNFWDGYYYDLDMEFVYGDGSKEDMEIYFEEGFEKLITEFESLATELEAKFS